jgi:hypothetical protein
MYMGEGERTLVELGDLLSRVARPHRCDDALGAEVQVSLWKLGLPYSINTTRQDLVAQIWARKRSVLAETPPSAA